MRHLLTACAIALSAFSQQIARCDDTGRAILAQSIADAVFRGPPDRYDVTYYETVVVPPQKIEVIREMVTKVYDATDNRAVNREGTPQRETELEEEVQRIHKAQQDMKPHRRVARIRISGDQTRIDQTVLKSGEPFKVTDLFAETRITARGKLIWYDHARRSALVQKQAKPWRKTKQDLNDWCATPASLRIFGAALLGKPGNPATRELILDPEKLSVFVSTGDQNVEVNVRPLEDISLSSLEFRSKDNPAKRTVFIVDHVDYSRVQEVAVYDGEHLISRTRYEGRDKANVPKKVRIEAWDQDGKLLTSRDINIISAAVNCNIPSEVFEWKPPAGYIQNDRTGEKLQVSGEEDWVSWQLTKPRRGQPADQ
jgi:hypothetical protein